jgi:Glycosyl-transferase for dystroglycan
VDFTLVTQSSLDRLWLLQHHCARWTGPISVAVYIGNDSITDNEPSQHTADSIRRDLVRDYNCTAQQLSIATIDGYTKETFPINALRNAALRGVTTSHVVFIDIDFLFPMHMRQELRRHFATDLAHDAKVALVLPAFELKQSTSLGNRNSADDSEPNLALVPNDKGELLRLWDPHRPRNNKEIDVFHKYCRECHGSTRYIDWVDQPDHVLLPISCIGSKLYEPYMAFRYCRDLPPFQEAFTGYGRNKHAWMLQTRRAGYRYQQVGGMFVIHVPHAHSSARKHHFNGMNGKKRAISPADQKEQSHREQMTIVFEHFVQWLNETVPDELVVPVCSSSSNLDNLSQ